MYLRRAIFRMDISLAPELQWISTLFLHRVVIQYHQDEVIGVRKL